jgi:Tfp pilus assembly protein PilF
VAALPRGESTVQIGGDLDYVLTAIPNHHPALSVMVRLARREKTARPAGARFSVECYFDRALRMAPDDGRVYTIYAGFLAEQQRADEALWSMDKALELSPDDPQVAYNLGLIALDLKDPDRAMQLARRAYAGGATLPGLKSRLQAAGQWRE